MSLYTTPLQSAYLLAWVYALLLWSRGYREERLSDGLLGWVLFFLGQEIQDYTLGFAGINFLWEELNGFPRGIGLLLPPALYLYLRAQTNRHFKLSLKHLWYLVPWGSFFLIELFIFLRGPYAVQAFQASPFLEPYQIIATIIGWGVYGYFFWLAINWYRRYRSWTATEFSDPDSIRFTWFRNVVFFMLAGIVFKEAMNGVDFFLDLDFYQDWWWNLALVGIIYYVGIWGYAQPQPAHVYFEAAVPLPDEEVPQAASEPVPAAAIHPDTRRLTQYMERERPYLDPGLTLAGLAQRVGMPAPELSARINGDLGQNFNDFVNQYRVEAFQRKARQPDKQALTFLAIALDCGFNSKATFNRAFHKHTGMSPREWLTQAKAAE
ncbi:MAG: AraC family transcriptional regulator [Bacteroidetes bacterium]|nr:MAG: AraC family transcriptional regulator [Bacteroidota bacterium]